jgi:hypothetical protein
MLRTASGRAANIGVNQATGRADIVPRFKVAEDTGSIQVRTQATTAPTVTDTVLEWCSNDVRMVLELC